MFYNLTLRHTEPSLCFTSFNPSSRLQQDTVEEDEGQYDIVTAEEVPAPELIPLTMTEPQDQPKKKSKKNKKKKQEKEVSSAIRTY